MGKPWCDRRRLANDGGLRLVHLDGMTSVMTLLCAVFSVGCQGVVTAPLPLEDDFRRKLQCEDAPTEVGAVPMRRLNQSFYRNAIADISSAARRFPRKPNDGSR